MNKDAVQSWLLQTGTQWDDVSEICAQTGVPPIDHAQQRIIEYLLEINRIASQSMSSPIDQYNAYLHIINGLVTFIEHQFTYEEQIIKEYQLPNLQQQQAEHTVLLTSFKKVLENFQQGRLQIIRQDRPQLQQKLLSHLNKTDTSTFSVETLVRGLDASNNWNKLDTFIDNTGFNELDTYSNTIVNDIISYATSNPKKKTVLLHLQQQLNERRAILQEIYSFNPLLNSLTPTPPVETAPAALNSLLKLSPNSPEEKFLFNTFVSSFVKDSTQLVPSISIIQNIDYSKTEASDIEWMIYSTGIEEIDIEHQTFIHFVFLLTNSLSLEQRAQSFKKILKLMQNHFKHEEQILKERNHPNILNHHQEHELFLSRVTKYFELFENNNIKITDQFKNRLLRWWITHTNSTDYQYFVLQLRHNEVIK